MMAESTVTAVRAALSRRKTEIHQLKVKLSKQDGVDI